MDVQRLRPLLPEALRPRLTALREAFQAEHPGAEVEDLVAWMHQQGHLDADQLREVLGSLDVTLTLGGGRLGADGPARPRLLGLLGRGGMGEVYIARDADLRRNVAVKRMHAELAADPELMARFANEVQITAQLDHPSIMPVYGLVAQDDGAPAYSMKLIRGRTLFALVQEARRAAKAGRPPPPGFGLRERVEVFLQVCDAMAHAHSRGVVHRDLKPENIMVGAFREVIVMDWGIARLMGGVERPVSIPGLAVGGNLTQVGMAVGTPAYMSPEQAQGLNEHLDGRSDLYALGLILAELLTLRMARQGKSAAHVLLRAAAGEEDPLDPLEKESPLPRELTAIVRKATATDPKDRYWDVAALAEDLRRWLRDEAVQAAPDSRLQRMARWVSRNRQTTLALGLALLVLLMGTAAAGVAAALVVRELEQRQAEERQAALAAVVGAAGHQARAMESALLRFEGLVAALATAAELRLAAPQPERPLYRAESFGRPGEGPPDLVPARFYGTPISLEHPDLVLAPGVDPVAARPRLLQLAALQPAFLDAHRRSVDAGDALVSDATLQGRLRGPGVPVVWSYVATEDGAMAGFPGAGVYPPDYDPRRQHWYQAVAARAHPHWEPAYSDESGLGLLVTCGRSLRDPQGGLLGVAAIDITVTWLVDALLRPEALAAPVEAWIVDREGLVVVQSSLAEAARTAGADYAPSPFPVGPVLEAVRASPAGGHREVDGTLYTWADLPTLGWTYLLSGDAAALLGE
jgi:eukaryotic-like serine/threonine-protein kinase